MFFTEPMIMFIALYASFVYSLVYFTLEAFPIVFDDQRGYGLVVSTLPFLGVFVGTCSALLVNLGNQPQYARAVEKNNGKPVPEARLLPMIIGGVFLAGGLFWFGWTANPKYSWALPVVAGGRDTVKLMKYRVAGANLDQVLSALVSTSCSSSVLIFSSTRMGSSLPVRFRLIQCYAL
jgi:hypothetical protein